MDKDSGLVQKVKVTAANISDVTTMPELLTGEEEVVYGDSGYLGAEIKNKQGKKIRYKINRRPSQIKNRSLWSQGQRKHRERGKSSVRAKVEHVFAVVKGMFLFRKTRYRGLTKQVAALTMRFTLVNLIPADRPSPAA